MKMRLLFVVAMVAMLTTSCASRALWKATDPDATVLIPENQVSETQLRDRGAPYIKDDHGIFHIGKTRTERFGDHALRAVFLPAAVCIDASPYIALMFLETFAERSGGSFSPTVVLPPWSGR